MIAGEATAKPPKAAAPLRRVRRSNRPCSRTNAMIFLPPFLDLLSGETPCAARFDIAPEIVALARVARAARPFGQPQRCGPDWRLRGAPASPAALMCGHLAQLFVS